MSFNVHMTSKIIFKRSLKIILQKFHFSLRIVFNSKDIINICSVGTSRS